MSRAVSQEFLRERIEVTKALIVAYEDALQTLGEKGGVQGYSLNTGQTTQYVTRASIPQLMEKLDGLYNRLAMLEARLCGGTVSYARPAW